MMMCLGSGLKAVKAVQKSSGYRKKSYLHVRQWSPKYILVEIFLNKTSIFFPKWNQHHWEAVYLSNKKWENFGLFHQFYSAQSLYKGGKPQRHWALQNISFGWRANFLANPVWNTMLQPQVQCTYTQMELQNKVVFTEPWFCGRSLAHWVPGQTLTAVKQGSVGTSVVWNVRTPHVEKVVHYAVSVDFASRQ